MILQLNGTKNNGSFLKNDINNIDTKITGVVFVNFGALSPPKHTDMVD
jgi:hypothetical protein